jgi:hypothetical protein
VLWSCARPRRDVSSSSPEVPRRQGHGLRPGPAGVRTCLECTLQPAGRRSGARCATPWAGVDRGFPLYRRDDAHYVKILCERPPPMRPWAMGGSPAAATNRGLGSAPGTRRPALGLAILDAVVRDATDREGRGGRRRRPGRLGPPARRGPAPVLRADVDGPRGRAAALALARAHRAAGRGEAQAALLEGLAAREAEHDRPWRPWASFAPGSRNAPSGSDPAARAPRPTAVPGALAAWAGAAACGHPADAAGRKCFEKPCGSCGGTPEPQPEWTP